MLRQSSLAFAKPNRVLENTIDMDQNHPSISKNIIVFGAATQWVTMAKHINISQSRQWNLFKRTILELLRSMEWVMMVKFYEAGATPPVRVIAIQASILGLFYKAWMAGKVGRWHFFVEKVSWIQSLMVYKLPQVVVLALWTIREHK